MKNKLYYVVLFLVVAISLFITYFTSVMAYFSISGFHSSSPCASVYRDGFNLEVLNERFYGFIQLSILISIVILISFYFLLKQKTKYYKIISISFSSILLIFMLWNFYEGKEAGLLLLDQCPNAFLYNKSQK